jgi:hypothetical protein
VYTLWTLYRSYFKSISVNIELQVYSVTCCRPYSTKHVGLYNTVKFLQLLFNFKSFAIKHRVNWDYLIVKANLTFSVHNKYTILINLFIACKDAAEDGKYFSKTLKYYQNDLCWILQIYVTAGSLLPSDSLPLMSIFNNTTPMKYFLRISMTDPT